jgi:hypothetical protein
MWEHRPLWVVLYPAFEKKKKRDNGDKPRQTGTLRREQREWLERSHRRKKTEPWEDETKHSPRKRNGGTPVGYSGRIDLFLGNGSINTFPRRQSIGKQDVAR